MTERRTGPFPGRILLVVLMTTIFGVGYFVGRTGEGVPLLRAAEATPARALNASPSPAEGLQSADRVYELRTYTAYQDKLEDLLTRFRDHTLRIFEKHGMTNVAYWTPRDAPLAENTLIYVLSYPSWEARDQSWEAFLSDPEWQRVAEESERNGRIVANVESVFMEATDFSPMEQRRAAETTDNRGFRTR